MTYPEENSPLFPYVIMSKIGTDVGKVEYLRDKKNISFGSPKYYFGGLRSLNKNFLYTKCV